MENQVRVVEFVWLLLFNGNTSLKFGIKEAFVKDLLFPSLPYLPSGLGDHIKHTSPSSSREFFSPAKPRLTRLDIPEMFKWGERGRNNISFQTHVLHQRQAKIGPGPIKKNICEIIFNTPNVPDGKLLGCNVDTSPHAEYCTFLEGAVEHKDIIEAIDTTVVAGLCPSPPWGHATTGIHPLQVLGFSEPASPSKQAGSL